LVDAHALNGTEKGQHPILYFGFYSNKQRGKWNQN
jgi:hypothetical protein